jgi:tetratricopeptide (TPR) repeat protein
MSDPLRTETSRAAEPASDAERDARIEQLLLAGLDRYFAAQYEEAINVWTRALFFDRSHARARAYIERARSALAERQRESEEMLQNGVAAFQRGEGDEARRLLEAAMVQGAPPDEALAVLDRLNRLEHAHGAPSPALPPSRERPSIAPAATRGRGRTALMVAGVCVLVAGVYVAARRGATLGGLFELPPTPAAAAPMPAVDAPLPLPERGAMALERARGFMLSGRLHDALAALDQVRATDAERADADRLRADIQRRLISLRQASRP